MIHIASDRDGTQERRLRERRVGPIRTAELGRRKRIVQCQRLFTELREGIRILGTSRAITNGDIGRREEVVAGISLALRSAMRLGEARVKRLPHQGQGSPGSVSSWSLRRVRR